MSTSINTITHALRASLGDSGSPIVLGHVFQLMAAALGYPSAAVLQASNEPRILEDSSYWVVDIHQLTQRAASLGLSIDIDDFLQALSTASYENGGPRIHLLESDLEEEFMDAAQEEALNDDSVAAEMANTNTTGPWDVYLESSEATSLPLDIGDIFSLLYEGQVQGEIDPERIYCGHSANVIVQVSLTAVGRRLLSGPPQVEVTGAALDDGFYGIEEAPAVPRPGRLEAYAMELGVPIEECEQLEGAEAFEHTTSAGVANGYLIDIDHCESSPIVDRLRAEHPSLQIWVQGGAIDRISSFDRG